MGKELLKITTTREEGKIKLQITTLPKFEELIKENHSEIGEGTSWGEKQLYKNPTREWENNITQYFSMDEWGRKVFTSESLNFGILRTLGVGTEQGTTITTDEIIPTEKISDCMKKFKEEFKKWYCETIKKVKVTTLLSVEEL